MRRLRDGGATRRDGGATAGRATAGHTSLRRISSYTSCAAVAIRPCSESAVFNSKNDERKYRKCTRDARRRRP